MTVHQATLEVPTRGKGTYEITRELRAILTRSGVREGLLSVFLRHTSASLVIYENADPSAREDLHAWFERLVPEGAPGLRHTDEGPDDSTSHLRTALTRSSETLPVRDGTLALGTWQGVFVFEHRRAAHRRLLDVTVLGQ
jgi:secondary thiamine-phosphate synthase enzyme